MRTTIAAACVAVVLGGCSSTNVGNLSVFGGDLAKPQVVLVSDFQVPPGAVSLDRSLAAKLRRSMKGASEQAMRAEVARRVSATIAETVVAKLRESGLEALPGSRQLAIEGQTTLVIDGSVRSVDEGNRTRRRMVGFGAGRSSVIADVQVSHLGAGGARDVLTFTTESESASGPGAIVAAPVSAATSAAVSVASAAGGVVSERLSAEVEAQARRIGETVAARVISFAAEQGWIRKPGV